MKPHIITLPTVQANLLIETCKDLGISIRGVHEKHEEKMTIGLYASQEDLEIAWEFFKERFEAIIN